MKYKFVDISEGVTIPVPRGLTSEQEQHIIAQFLAQHDPAALEAELRELLEQFEQGKLVSFEDVLKELEKVDDPPRKESA